MPQKVKNKIGFHFPQKTTLADRSRLKRFLNKSVRTYGYEIKDIGVIFCSDHYLLNINKLHLKHNYFTDIITFQYSASGDPLSAELYISVDRVKENASQLGVSFRSELHRVIFHGILHLLGYRDKSGPDKKEMRREEDKWLKKYGI